MTGTGILAEIWEAAVCSILLSPSDASRSGEKVDRLKRLLLEISSAGFAEYHGGAG